MAGYYLDINDSPGEYFRTILRTWFVSPCREKPWKLPRRRYSQLSLLLAHSTVAQISSEGSASVSAERWRTVPTLDPSAGHLILSIIHYRLRALLDISKSKYTHIWQSLQSYPISIHTTHSPSSISKYLHYPNPRASTEYHVQFLRPFTDLRRHNATWPLSRTTPNHSGIILPTPWDYPRRCKEESFPCCPRASSLPHYTEYLLDRYTLP